MCLWVIYKKKYEEKIIFFCILKVTEERVGSIIQRDGSGYPDPHRNVRDPQYKKKYGDLLIILCQPWGTWTWTRWRKCLTSTRTPLLRPGVNLNTDPGMLLLHIGVFLCVPYRVLDSVFVESGSWIPNPDSYCNKLLVFSFHLDHFSLCRSESTNRTVPNWIRLWMKT